MKRRAPREGRSTATETAPAAPTGRVLGDLLRADPAAPRVPEQEWADLVRAVAARDQSALRALYERSYKLAFTLIMRLTHDRQTAEELTVDVFHDVWRRAGDYDPANGSVLGWIMNQARSRAIDRLRYQSRRKRVNPFPDELAEATGDDVAVIVDREALAARLRTAAGVLTAAERETVEAAFLTDLTHAEIAAQTGVPLGTVKTRIRSALAKLRRQLDADQEAS